MEVRGKIRCGAERGKQKERKRRGMMHKVSATALISSFIGSLVNSKANGVESRMADFMKRKEEEG